VQTKSRRDQVNDIEAIDEKGKVQIWQLFKSEAGLWTLRDAQGIEIEFETTLNKSKQAMQRCLQNRGLTAKI
jgi:hypothetical protein